MNVGKIDSLIHFSMYIGNLKLLGRLNALSTSTVELAPLIILTIMYDYVLALLQTLYLATTDDWVGHGPPHPPF